MIFKSMVKRKPRIALIADEYTAIALEPEAEIIHLTPRNWRWQLMGRKRPDLLFVESAWRGIKGTWKGKIAASVADIPASNIQPALITDIVAWFQQRKIPTLFWNKEDPVCFKRFAQTAALFDLIYTTDQQCEVNYRSPAFAKTQFVGTLPFAVQPAHFHPDHRINRLPNIVFAGGYYGAEYPQRSQQQEVILNALMDQSLIIYDRFWQKGSESQFPQALSHFCQPAVPYRKMPELFRQHQLYINFNTVNDSPSMLSRRVLEIAACGGAIISTPSPALTSLFDDTVPQITDAASAKAWGQRFLQDALLRIETGKKLSEAVMSQHTWRHRFEQISQETGVI